MRTHEKVQVCTGLLICLIEELDESYPIAPGLMEALSQQELIPLVTGKSVPALEEVTESLAAHYEFADRVLDVAHHYRNADEVARAQFDADLQNALDRLTQ